ncbi:hypothetical protein EQ718_07125 [Paracoccus versutus]|uniref:Uncharacterized protein n=1 Tax=Paracoccus versutus TaxID=34007 RepID=A0AAQ0HJJ7_PARVE|nr:hypothetical protein [Paracoccus versutus]KGJ12369.1 hypothetical protein IT40_02345 [Paracoccus versutus]REG48363.1 hypothetical protein ATH84_100994 [Paracoccus versutus]WEJ78665.1 hypothetical protein EQ718_07125 [Paracoccus versutus]
MTSHEDEPATRRTPFAEKPKTRDAPEPAETPPTPEQLQSGKAVLLNWCIMLAGFGAIALAAYWLLG